LFYLYLQGPSGDVVSSRTCAKAMLGALDAPSEVRRDARLILTAACLFLHGRTGPKPGLSDVISLLEQLGPGQHGRGVLAASPMQFLRFVDAELAELGATCRAAAIDLCFRALRRCTPEKSNNTR